MVQAYILIQTDAGRSGAVAQQVGEFDGVTMVDHVMGAYDVIARVEAENVDDLGKLIVAKFHDLPGITRTLTCTVVNV